MMPPVTGSGISRSSIGALLCGASIRNGRDALAPVIVFYLGWKGLGLTAGIVGATLVALVAYAWNRKHARSPVAAAIGLGIALVQAFAGLASGSAIGYLTPSVLSKGLYALALMVSVVIRRPLVGLLAQDMYPFPPAVRASVTFRRVFSRISLVWGGYFFLRSAFGALLLIFRKAELFIALDVVIGVTCSAALITWSTWYGLRAFHRSDEWASALNA
jgi:hypothetical protein